MNTLTLGLITTERAQSLMCAPALAGGWIMVGCEAANRVRAWDELSALSGLHRTMLLAAIPASWGAASHMFQVWAPDALAILDADIERTAQRTWARQSIEDDLAMLRVWRGRIATAAEAKD